MSVISRRAVLRSVGHTAAVGAVAAALPHRLLAAAATAPAGAAICMSMIYQSVDETKFDADAYRDRHVPLLKSAYGDSVERVELRVPPKPMEGMPAPPLMASASIWIRDVDSFVERIQKSGKDIAEDIATITNVGPILQFDQVIYSGGEARTMVPIDCPCISSFFPVKEGGTWNAKYYAEIYLPNLIEIYGPEAILRIEALEGTDQAGPKRVHGAVHMYINDEAAYEEASGKAELAELAAEGAQQTTLSSLGVLMRVHAAA